MPVLYFGEPFMLFKDRREAGKRLTGLLSHYEKTPSIIYALPRGGVVVGAEVAKDLKLPIDVVITRKVGHPDNPEYAIAAVTEEGEVLANQKESSPISESWFDEEVERQRQEAKRRRQVYTAGRERLSSRGKNAIIIDDGVATGLSLVLAIKEIKRDVPWKIIVAVPVTPADSAKEIKKDCDEFYAVLSDDHYLGAVGAYYENFDEVSDEEVISILNELSPFIKKTNSKRFGVADPDQISF